MLIPVKYDEISFKLNNSDLTFQVKNNSQYSLYNELREVIPTNFDEIIQSKETGRFIVRKYSLFEVYFINESKPTNVKFTSYNISYFNDSSLISCRQIITLKSKNSKKVIHCESLK